MASGDIHYRSPLAAPRRDLRDDRAARILRNDLIHEIETGDPSVPRQTDLHNVIPVSRIIWSAWKPNYIFRRRSPIDFQTESRVTLIDKYLAKSWWSNGRESVRRAMILGWSTVSSKWWHWMIHDYTLHICEFFQCQDPPEPVTPTHLCRSIVIVFKLGLTIL